MSLCYNKEKNSLPPTIALHKAVDELLVSSQEVMDCQQAAVVEVGHNHVLGVAGHVHHLVECGCCFVVERNAVWLLQCSG